MELMTPVDALLPRGAIGGVTVSTEASPVLADDEQRQPLRHGAAHTRPPGCARVVLVADPDLLLRPALVDLVLSGSERVPRIAAVRGTASASNAKTVGPRADQVDFSDPESQRVLRAAARAVACELGREAAREYFAELIRRPEFS